MHRGGSIYKLQTLSSTTSIIIISNDTYIRVGMGHECLVDEDLRN